MKKKMYKGYPLYPCPSERELTDVELETIRYSGEKMLKADGWEKPKFPGDEWKDQ